MSGKIVQANISIQTLGITFYVFKMFTQVLNTKFSRKKIFFKVKSEKQNKWENKNDTNCLKMSPIKRIYFTKYFYLIFSNIFVIL